jgi:hypothetical protein
MGLGLRSKIELGASCCDADEGRAGGLCSAGGLMAARGAATAVHQYGHANGGALVPGGETAAGSVSAEDRARLFRKYELPPFVPGNILQSVQAYNTMTTERLLITCIEETVGPDGKCSIPWEFTQVALAHRCKTASDEEARAACLPRIAGSVAVRSCMDYLLDETEYRGRLHERAEQVGDLQRTAKHAIDSGDLDGAIAAARTIKVVKQRTIERRAAAAPAAAAANGRLKKTFACETCGVVPTKKQRAAWKTRHYNRELLRKLPAAVVATSGVLRKNDKLFLDVKKLRCLSGATEDWARCRPDYPSVLCERCYQECLVMGA